MRSVPNKRLGPFWALLEHEIPIPGSFPVVHSVGGANTARLHHENEHRGRRKVHTTIDQHQGPLTLVLFVAAGARVAHQARAVVATRSRDKNAPEQPTPATASWGSEEARTRVKTTPVIIPRTQPSALQPPALPRLFWGGVRQRQIVMWTRFEHRPFLNKSTSKYPALARCRGRAATVWDPRPASRPGAAARVARAAHRDKSVRCATTEKGQRSGL